MDGTAVTRMHVWDDVSDSGWLDLADMLSWDLSEPEGPKVIHASFQDEQGRVSAPVDASITLCPAGLPSAPAEDAVLDSFGCPQLPDVAVPTPIPPIEPVATPLPTLAAATPTLAPPLDQPPTPTSGPPEATPTCDTNTDPSCTRGGIAPSATEQPTPQTLATPASLPTPSDVTVVDLYAFGNAQGPRPPRVGQDLEPDEAGFIPPGEPPEPPGASTFGDPDQAPLTGIYWKLPAGTPLPVGLLVIADGSDVLEGSQQPPTHHTIFASEAMPAQRFVDLYAALPWERAGRR